MYKSCFKAIENDFRRNPINYAMLLLSIIVCAAASLFLFRTLRMNVSTSYDSIYTFKVKELSSLAEANSLIQELNAYDDYSYRVGCYNIGKIEFTRRKTFGEATFTYGVVLTSDYILKLDFPLLENKNKVYVPKEYLGVDSQGKVYSIGDKINILGSDYEIVAAYPHERRAQDFYISVNSPPAQFDYSMLQPITLAFKERLSNAQLAQFESLGLKQIADDNYVDVFLVMAMAGVSLLTMFFAFLIAAGVLRQNGSDMAKLRLLGGRRVGVAAANAIMLSLFFVVGFFIAVAIDAAVAAVYDYEGKVPFEDALRIEDFVIEFVFLASVFAAFMTARFFAKSGRISEELKG